MDSPYGGIHFYSHHLIESALYAFGYDVKSVFAKRNNRNVIAVLTYDNFSVILNFASGYGDQYIGLCGNDVCMEKMELNKCIDLQFEQFAETVKTNSNPFPAIHFVTSVKVSNAIEKSMDAKREIDMQFLKD